jgi:hypothetical protein
VSQKVFPSSSARSSILKRSSSLDTLPYTSCDSPIRPKPSAGIFGPYLPSLWRGTALPDMLVMKLMEDRGTRTRLDFLKQALIYDLILSKS